MLILHLPLHPQAAAGAGAPDVAYVHSPDGLSVTRSGRAPLDSLGASDDVVAVVPWQCLSWHAVTLPPHSGGRLSAVLHGLLEEQLLADPASLHLALAPGASPRRGGATLVAACSRAWLQHALAPLEAAGLRVQRLVPECAPLDPTQAEPSLQLVAHDAQVWGLLSHALGVTPIPQDSRSAWSDQLNQVSRCTAEPAVAQHAPAWGAQDALLQPDAQRWLQAARGPWNLAQGEWGQSRAQRGTRWLQSAWSTWRHHPAWRPVRWGAALLVLAQLVGLNVWAWREESLLQARQQQLRQLLTDTFPHVRVVVDPALQMRREVQALRQATGAPSPQDADHLLARLSRALPAQASVQQLNYAAGELHWQASGAESLDAAAQQQLQADGYRVSRSGELQVLRWEGPR